MNNKLHVPIKTLPTIIYGLIIFTIISKLLPHPFNFTSVGSLSLFAGAFLPLRTAWAAPIFTLFVSDAVTGFYDPVVMFFVYIGFACSTLVGRIVLLKKRTVIKLISSAFIAACLFFIISNFGMWIAGGYYPLTLDGLITCYIRGIPYFKHTLAGNILYTFFLFGAYEIIRLIYLRSMLANANRFQ